MPVITMASTIVAVATAIATVLFYFGERLQVIVRSHRARRWVRNIVAQKADASRCEKPHDNGRQPRVSGIFIHPVKSLRPVSLAETRFDRHGLVDDRRLMIVRPNPPLRDAVSAATHRFLTQRQAPRLATIDAALERDGERMLLRLSAASAPDAVRLDISPPAVAALPVRHRAALWSDVVSVADVGDRAAAFVARIVAKDDPAFADVRVVALVEDATARPVDAAYCPAAARVGPWGALCQGGLTDGFPILVAAQASLDELNGRLAHKHKEKLPMSRFRPNIVIDRTSAPFDEDRWKAIKIGQGDDAVILHIAKGCPRCAQACTDQMTGARGAEPLATLAEYRARNGAGVYFAQNAALDRDSYGGMIRAGDPVTVLARGEPVWDAGTVPAE